MAEKLRAGRLELLELDIDIRLYSLMVEAGLQEIITRSEVEDLVIKSHWCGFDDATDEEKLGKLYTDNGYRESNLETPVPESWWDPGYTPENEELIDYYECAWDRDFDDSDFATTSKLMRAAYGLGYTFGYLIRQSLETQ